MDRIDRSEEFYEDLEQFCEIRRLEQNEDTNQRRSRRRPTRKKSFRIVAVVMMCMVLSSATTAGTMMLMQRNQQANQVSDLDLSGGEQQWQAVNTTALLTNNTTGSVATAVDKAAASVVEISTESVQQDYRYGVGIVAGAGSGVILTTDGYIVTNHHVIDGASNIMVRLADGSVYQAGLVATDPQTDLAVIKITAENLVTATFADSDAVRTGDLALAIGNPLGNLGGTVTAGIISAKDREIMIDGQVRKLMQTSAAVNRGNSGGGLFDSQGNLIGIVNAKSAGVDIEGIGFAIPTNLVKQTVDALLQNSGITITAYTEAEL